LTIKDINANAKETEADLENILDIAKKAQEWNIAILKAKINPFHQNNTSSRPPNSAPSTSAPRPPKKLPNMAAKNLDFCYCGRKGHFEVDCNDRCHAGASMVGANGISYSQHPSAMVNSNTQAHANPASLFATTSPTTTGQG
jgi:hypothetical protein